MKDKIKLLSIAAVFVLLICAGYSILSFKQTDLQSILKKESSKKDLFIDHFENIVQNLRSTYEMIEFEGLEKLVDLIYQSNEICFAGNFFTQSVSMQLQIELSYLGKKCTGMYPLQSQKEVVRNLKENDLIIVSSIAGGYWQDHPDMLREIAKSKAHKICVTQVENMPYQDQFDMIIQVGTDHLSLIGKFSITYIFELLEALYHIKYGRV